MAETNAPPTDAEIKLIRVDIENYLIESRTLTSYASAALSQFKLDIEDKRGVSFSQVFDDTNDLYFTDTDGNTRNLQKIRQDMLCYLASSMVFRDYAIATSDGGGSQWWDLANEYESRYDERLKIAKLDVDLDEDGSISEDEEKVTAQTFMVR